MTSDSYPQLKSATPSQGKSRANCDGNGLNLLVHTNGSKYFQLRYTLHGKEKTLQLGVYPAMGLAEARVAAKAARQLVITGMDLVQNKRIQDAKKASSAANLQVRRRPVVEYQTAHSSTIDP